MYRRSHEEKVIISGRGRHADLATAGGCFLRALEGRAVGEGADVGANFC